MKQDKKRAYIAPEIKATLIELEEAIAAGSASVRPVGTTGTVQQSWDQGADDNHTYTWQ